MVGENGSGKSAVLVGIQLGLGGKTGNTGRGATSTVVMHGKESALVRITLYNEGDDAFDQKRYSDLIAVERIIRASTGSSSYKIMNGRTKKTISTKKADLSMITDHFDIQVDNPIAILCQEEAKKFIKSKDPKAMYTNFMKATQMDKMSHDYETLHQDLETMKARISNKKGGSSALEQDYEKAEKKYKDLQKLRKIEEKRDHLVKEAVWASVQEREGDAAKKQSEIDACEDLHFKIEKKIEKWDKKHAEFADKMGPTKEQIKEIAAQMDASAAELTQATIELKRFRGERKQEEQSRKDCERELKEKESSMKRLQRQLEEQKAENDAQEQEDERQARQDEIDELEKELKDIRDSKTKASHDYENLVEDSRRIEGRIEDAEHKVKENHSFCTNAKGQLANLKQSASGGGGINRRITLYGPNHKKLNEAIGRAKWKDAVPPIGPLGAYIDLKDDSYSVAIEKAIGRTQIAYACANREDSVTLRKLIMRTAGQREGSNIDVLTVQREARFEVRDYLTSDLKREKVPTLGQLISIENDYVYNVVANFAKIDRVGVIESGPELRRIIFESRNDAGKMGRFYTKDGDMAYPGAGRRYYMNKDTRRMQRMVKAGVDMSQQLADASAEVDRCTVDFEDAKTAKTQLTRSKQEKAKLIREAEKIMKQCRQKMTDKEREISIKNKQVNEMKEANVDDDYTYLEDEIAASQQEFSEKQEQIKVAKQSELEKRKAEKPFGDKVTALKADAERLGEQNVQAQQTIAELEDKQGQAKKSVAKYKTELKQTAHDLADHNADLKAMNDLLQDELKTAEDMKFERVETKKASAKIQKEIETIEERIKEETKKRGDPAAITAEYVRARDTWESATRDIKNLEDFSKKIDVMLGARIHSLNDFKKYVGRSVKREFTDALGHRNYTGKMTFKHDAQSIAFTVNPREVDKKILQQAKDTSAETGRANTLSGGERSFTTASFILSLWAEMESPFRALDEFDVFMDAVNRQIAINMMIDAARRKKDKQFILLSPLTMKIIDDLNGPDIRVIRMKPPIRGQSTLVESQLN